MTSQLTSAWRAVVVMGVSGSGKSTIGERIASTLGFPFLEGDQFHPAPNIEKMTSGIALTDEDRWPWLKALGTAIGETARTHPGVVNACSALKRSYRERLRDAAALPIRFVCLTGDRQVIADRMQRRRGHYMPTTLLDSQLADFELPGDDENALVLDLRLSVDELVAAALADLCRTG